MEKYFKAYLVKHDIDFPKTHDIEYLLDAAAKWDESFSQFSTAAALFTEYAIEIRYEETDIDAAEIASALETTEQISSFLISKLKN